MTRCQAYRPRHLSVQQHVPQQENATARKRKEKASETGTGKQSEGKNQADAYCEKCNVVAELCCCIFLTCPQ